MVPSRVGGSAVEQGPSLQLGWGRGALRPRHCGGSSPARGHPSTARYRKQTASVRGCRWTRSRRSTVRRGRWGSCKSCTGARSSWRQVYSLGRRPRIGWRQGPGLHPRLCRAQRRLRWVECSVQARTAQSGAARGVERWPRVGCTSSLHTATRPEAVQEANGDGAGGVGWTGSGRLGSGLYGASTRFHHDLSSPSRAARSASRWAGLAVARWMNDSSPGRTHTRSSKRNGNT